MKCKHCGKQIELKVIERFGADMKIWEHIDTGEILCLLLAEPEEGK